MRLALPAFALLLSACSDRRPFDERYNDTARNIEERAAAIDSNLTAATEEPGDKPQPER